MITQSELERLQDKGLIKIPLIVAVLTEAKKQGLKWIFQCEGENFYPWTEANLETGNYDAWTYTDDIEASLKEHDATDMMHILFDKGGWILWVSCNEYDMDKLADFTTDLDWVESICDKYDS
tara:strand:+ start:161 stop:526 length:366 start_codon:yes stop_codon:yes gene_type:complete